MGSSLGGYLAALYAARHANIEKLVLLAPAFQFPNAGGTASAPRTCAMEGEGTRKFYHYAFKEERPLGYQFVEDAVNMKTSPIFRQPALILHGTRTTWCRRRFRAILRPATQT